jgi:asparagine synthase (glutamine-hydrolysing)
LGGIAGIVHFQGSPPDREQVMQLSTGVAHRGRDDKALVYTAPAGLAQRIFSTEREADKPPFDDGRYVVLLDGTANQERLLAGWAQRGIETLSEVPGAFAIAIWDRTEQVMWLARDPTGTRPLFYAHHRGKLAFSSAMRPLLGLPWVSTEIAVDHLAEYLSFRYTHAPRTLLRDVSAVPPGHIVRISASGARITRWWNPVWWTPGGPSPDLTMIVDRIDTALRRSVERRLRTHQPTGLLLSGGLDSAAILHHATAIRGEPLPTYTVTIDGDERDESAFAARVAGTYGAPHTLIRVSTQALVAAVDDATLNMGQPLPSPAALVQHCLFHQINAEVRCLLSGAGGDEVLGGRTMPQIAQRLRRARTVSRLPGPARLVGRTVAKKAGWSDLSSAAAHFGLERKIGGSRVFSAAERVALLQDPAMARPGIRSAILEPFYQEVSSDPINEILHVWQRGWLSEDVLARADRMAAPARIHTRFPLLDTEFLIQAAAITGAEKCRRKGMGYMSKAPLRMAMEGRLPERLLNRPKRAEPSPMANWTRGPGAAFLRARIAGAADRCADLFVPEAIHTRMKAHLAGEADHAVQLWAIVMFDAWRVTLD